jgi:pimeloyl-ACP methyl ester carboxylesterase
MPNQTLSGAGAGTPGWLDRPGLPHLAFNRLTGRGPGVVFLSGFASDMTGTKASALAEAAEADGHAFLRFDYRGHGASEGRLEDGAIGDWFADALAMFDRMTEGPQIVVGSSMGGWIAILLALARPERIRALVGIAAAPDFTERLVAERLTAAQRAHLEQDGVIWNPSQYGDPLPLTRRLIEDGRKHLVLDRPIPFAGPIRLLHGQRDPDVPWELSLALASRMAAEDVRITLIKDGDHRLSRPADIALLVDTVAELAEWRRA